MTRRGRSTSLGRALASQGRSGIGQIMEATMKVGTRGPVGGRNT